MNSPGRASGTNTAERVPTNTSAVPLRACVQDESRSPSESPGVKGRDAAGEPLAKAGEELRGEADLRNEHQHLAPAGDDGLDEPQVHLRLAAAGDAVEHEGGELPEARLDRFHRAALLGVEGRATGTVGMVGKVGSATLPVVQNRAIRTAGCIGLIGPALPIVAPDWTIGTVRRIGTVGPKRRVRDGLRPNLLRQVLASAGASPDAPRQAPHPRRCQRRA